MGSLKCDNLPILALYSISNRVKSKFYMEEILEVDLREML